MAKNILVIDDDKIVLRTIQKLLIKEGYALNSVESGQRAIEAIKNTFYDLIITDIRMPQIDGIEAIRKIKKLQEGTAQQSRFLVITGYSDPEASGKAAELGVKYFLMKPLDKDLNLLTKTYKNIDSIRNSISCN